MIAVHLCIVLFFYRSAKCDANKKQHMKRQFDYFRKYGLDEQEKNCSYDQYISKHSDINPCKQSFASVKKNAASSITDTTKKYSFFFLTISMAGFLFNIIIVSINYRVSAMRNYQFIIVLLAVFHIIFSLFLLIVAFPLFWAEKWILGQYMCKVAHLVVIVGSHVPIGFILSFAIDRFVCVCYSFNIFPRWKIIIYIFFYIIVAFLVNIFLFFNENLNNYDSNVCWDNWLVGYTSSLGFNVFLLVYYIILPIITFVVLYHKTISFLNYLKHSSKCKHKRYIKTMRIVGNKRILRISASMLFTFIVCTLPVRIISIGGSNFLEKYPNTYNMVHFLLPLLYVVVNPPMYVLSDHMFRRKVRIYVIKSILQHRRIRGFIGRIQIVFLKFCYKRNNSKQETATVILLDQRQNPSVRETVM